MIFDANTNDAAILKKSLGVFITYGYGQALPELKTQIMALHAVTFDQASTTSDAR